MEPRLIQHQTQKLILSPQIRQYLRLLQMPITDLSQAVEAELSENPLLEEKQVSPEDDGEVLESAEAAPTPASEEIKIGDSYDKLGDLDDDYPERHAPYDYGTRNTADLQKNKDFQKDKPARYGDA